MNRVCEISGCTNKIRSGKCKWCEKHYYRNRRNGHPEKLTRCQYVVNEKVFDEWNDSSAWLIGILWTDGYIVAENSFGIKLKDMQLLEEIKHRLGTDIKTKIYKNKDTEGEYGYFSIANKHIADRLRSIGMHQNKTFTIQYPLGMPDNLFGSFLRGVIDGDGSVYIPKNRNGQKVKDCRLFFVTASKEFAMQMIDKLNNIGIKTSLNIREKYLKSGKLCKQWKGSNLWKIQILEIESLRRSYEIMYPNSEVPCLHRKRDPFREFYETPRIRAGNPSNFAGFWDKEKLSKLKSMFLNPDISKDEICIFFNRKWSSILSAVRDKLKIANPCYWSEDEDRILTDNYQTYDWKNILSLLPNRNKSGCVQRAKKLKLTRRRLTKEEK